MSITLRNKQKELAQLRGQLRDCRPPVTIFSRMHKYQEDTPPFEWKEKLFEVALRQFNAEPGLEEYALDLGEKIKELKREVRVLELKESRPNQLSVGRKALMKDTV